MSGTMKWRPVPRVAHFLDYPLKCALIKRWNSGEFGREHPIKLTSSDIPFLEGLLCAEIGEAKKLIDAIEKHDEIHLWIDY